MAKNYFGITDTGKQRSNNEDTFIAEPVMNGRYIAACVIDGVGGYDGGEVAAEIARQTIKEHLTSVPENLVSRLRDAIAAANNKILNQKRETKQNGQMACVVTLALADVEENKFYYAHVGDTRLYLLRDQSLVKVTHDHSFVGFLEDSGRLSEEAAMKHPKRNEINKALGFDGEISSSHDYIETGDSPFLPGDTLLLCSDGLSDMVSNKGIAQVLTSSKSLAEKAKTLVNAANDAGGKDNVTVVLVHNDKPPVKQEATKPAIGLKKNIENNPQQVALSNKEYNSDIRREVPKKKSSGTVRLLLFLLLLVLAALIWVLYRDYAKTKDAEEENVAKSALLERNDREQAFVDQVDKTANGEVFVLNSSPGQPLIITDSILIHKDTLRVIGNGITFVADTAYSGPAFIVAANTRYFLLDSLTLQGFDIGVLMRSPGLHLRNVQFKECKVPVQYQFGFPAGATINGNITDTAFRYTNNTQNNF